MNSDTFRLYCVCWTRVLSGATRSIRHHWNIENKLHWATDVDFDEDQCRVRIDHGPENFGLLRQIAHNMLKQESSRGISIRRKIKKAGWDNGFLTRILIGSA